MSGLAEQALEEIKRRTSVVSLIGEYVTLKKTGNSHKGLCPFHGEKTPSFHVNDAKGFFYCFGCGASGDAITFLRQQFGYSFIEAVRLLADRAGVELPERLDTGDPAQRQQRRQTRERYYDLHDDIQRFFRSQLADDALAYLEGARGLSRETIDRYGLGYGPDSWDLLVQAAGRGSGGVRAAAELGLIGRRERSDGYYSKVRHRVTFPVYALSGQIAGFSSRTLSSDKDVPKYVNSSESEIYAKGRLLYGLYQARQAVRNAGRAIVVEGNVDVLTLAQAGFEETVAPLGTALTEDQCRLLKRFTHDCVLVYDGDRAGRAATMKAIPMVMAAGLHGKVVALPDGEDPDSFVRSGGREALDEAISTAQPLFDAFVAHALEEYDGTVPSKAAAVGRIAPIYWLLEEASERELYRRRLRRMLDVREDELERWLRRARQDEAGHRDEAPSGGTIAAGQTTRKAPTVERDLLQVILLHPQLLGFWDARGGSGWLTHDGIRDVLTRMSGLVRPDGELDIVSLMDSLQRDGRGEARSVVARLLADVDRWGDRFEAVFVELTGKIEEKFKAADEARMKASQRTLSVDEQFAALRERGYGKAEGLGG